MNDKKEISTPRRWYSVLALAAASFVDGGESQSLSILWPYMYRSLGLSVGQLGPALGISRFVSMVMLPIWGYLVDRFSRKSLLVGLTGFWGLWTCVIAYVDTFPELIVVRVLSALGIGVFVPAAFSLLSDLFEDKRRGQVSGLVIGISIFGAIISFGLLPYIAGLSEEGWRNGFILMGLGSFLTGILLLFIHEPPRGASEPEISDVITTEAAKQYMFQWRDFPVLFRIKSWRWILLSEVLRGLGIGAFGGWVFTWLDGLGLGDSVFIIVGLISLSSVFGAIFFGWLGDRMEERYPNYGRLSMVLIASIILLPSTILFLTVDPQNVNLLIAIGFVFGAAGSVVDVALYWPITQGILLPELRGSGRALIDMAGGLSAAFILTASGLLADQVGVSNMLLTIMPLPLFLTILAWLPLFKTYIQDRNNLHEIMLERSKNIAKLDS